MNNADAELINGEDDLMRRRQVMVDVCRKLGFSLVPWHTYAPAKEILKIPREQLQEVLSAALGVAADELCDFRPPELRALILILRKKWINNQPLDCIKQTLIPEWHGYRNTGRTFLLRLREHGWLTSEGRPRLDPGTLKDRVKLLQRYVGQHEQRIADSQKKMTKWKKELSKIQKDLDFAEKESVQ